MDPPLPVALDQLLKEEQELVDPAFLSHKVVRHLQNLTMNSSLKRHPELFELDWSMNAPAASHVMKL